MDAVSTAYHLEDDMRVGAREAKNKLSRYGRIAHEGNKIVVTKNGEPWFDIVPHRANARRTTPLSGVKPTISLEEAIAPIRAEDVPGWI